MVNSALATGDFFKLKPGDTALMCLSAEFIAGKMMLVRAMVLGLALDIVAPDTTPLEKTANTYDFCAMVPLQARNSLSQLFRIKILLLGGAPVSTELSKELIRYGSGIFETYGMTETITHIAVRKIAVQGTAGNSSYFRTLPHVQIIRDQRGCLVIDAPGITEGSIVTNDLVELKGTRHFKWLGRYDNVINSGGVKLIPEQIEAKLSEQLQHRFFVAGVPDAEFGEKLVLFLEGEHDTKQILEDIRKGNSLRKYEIPKAAIPIPKFEETKSGKVDRKAILKSFLED